MQGTRVEFASIETFEVATALDRSLDSFDEPLESRGLLEETSTKFLSNGRLLFRGRLGFKDGAEQLITSTIEEGVDEAFRLAALRQTSGLLVGGVNITFQKNLHVDTFIEFGDEVGETSQLNAGGIAANYNPIVSRGVE